MWILVWGRVQLVGIVMVGREGEGEVEWKMEMGKEEGGEGEVGGGLWEAIGIEHVMSVVVMVMLVGEVLWAKMYATRRMLVVQESVQQLQTEVKPPKRRL